MNLTMRRLLRLSVICLPLLAGACSSVQPWVKPYERQYLADPIMSFGRDPIANGFRNHVYESREGARGASGATGGGCGCN